MKNDIFNALGVRGWDLASVLDHIGGSSQDIIDRVQGMYEAGEMTDIFTGEQMSVQECAEECIRSIRGEIVRAWIRRMPRETVNALVSAFDGVLYAKITLAEGVEVYLSEIPEKWSDAHPDKEALT